MRYAEFIAFRVLFNVAFIGKKAFKRGNRVDRYRYVSIQYIHIPGMSCSLRSLARISRARWYDSSSTNTRSPALKNCVASKYRPYVAPQVATKSSLLKYKCLTLSEAYHILTDYDEESSLHLSDHGNITPFHIVSILCAEERSQSLAKTRKTFHWAIL